MICPGFHAAKGTELDGLCNLKFPFSSTYYTLHSVWIKLEEERHSIKGGEGGGRRGREGGREERRGRGEKVILTDLFFPVDGLVDGELLLNEAIPPAPPAAAETLLLVLPLGESLIVMAEPTGVDLKVSSDNLMIGVSG